MKTAKIKLPQIVTANDYHGFSEMAEQINMVADITVKGKEIGFSGGEYVGILYTGAMPTKDEIKKLLTKEKIQLEK